ncbi:MAG: LacI family transcriptional regulator [Chitinophagaceae bacterium]|nr:LacI family transcriptional regulator [Chitinophagaceae bacterium]
MNYRSTLKNISEKLNISISTVSRALKNHPDISESTKRKVKDLAVLMEYEPNTYAVNLRTNVSKVFGLIVPAISNLFYESFIAAVEEDARQLGYSLMILQSGNDPVTEIENLKLCKQTRVAGIFICVATHAAHTETYLKYIEAGMPLVFFDNVPDIDSCNKVCPADEEAATISAATIIKYKKKKVLGIFGNPELSISRKRMEAFRKTFAADAPKTQLEIQHADSSQQAKEIVQTYFSSKKADHIFCMSDEILMGVMQATYKLGLTIPTDVSILAISNGFLPALFNPAITYVETSGYKLGKLAMRSMSDHLNGQTFTKVIILPSLLIEGASMQ